MIQDKTKRISPNDYAKKIFHDHYDVYLQELDIFSATLLAKRNSSLYVRAIIDKIEEEGATKNQEDYFYFLNTKLELELI